MLVGTCVGQREQMWDKTDPATADPLVDCCVAHSTESLDATGPDQGVDRALDLKISGMMCAANCARRVREALAALSGVTEAQVDFDTKTAMVRFREPPCSEAACRDAVFQAGDFTVTEVRPHTQPTVSPASSTAVTSPLERSLEMRIDGMKCAANCARRVREALAALAGMDEARVDFDQKTATVRFHEPPCSEAACRDAVFQAGDFTVAQVTPLGLVGAPAPAPVSTEAATSCGPSLSGVECALDLKISGMMCAANCARRVREALAALSGVTEAQVDFDTKTAMVRFREPPCSEAACRDAVFQAGDFTVTEVLPHSLATTEPSASLERSLELRIDGMKCAANCARRVREALAALAGMDEARVDFDQKTATVRFHEPPCSEAACRDAVFQAGDFTVTQVTPLGPVGAPALAPPVTSLVPTGATASCGPSLPASRATLPAVSPLDVDAPTDGPVVIRVTGMSCASCVAHVEDAIRHVPGVRSVAVNLLAEKASVQGTVVPRALLDAVKALGYGASVIDSRTEKIVFQVKGPRAIPLPQTRELFAVWHDSDFRICLVAHLPPPSPHSTPADPSRPASVLAARAAALASGWQTQLAPEDHAARSAITAVRSKGAYIEVAFTSAVAPVRAVYRSLQAAIERSQPGAQLDVVSDPSVMEGDTLVRPATRSRECILLVDRRMGASSHCVKFTRWVAVWWGGRQLAESRHWRLLFLLSLVATVPLFALGMIVPLVPGWEEAIAYPIVPGLTVDTLVMAVLSTFCQLVLCGPFYAKAWRTLRTGKSDMNVLVALGTTCAWAYSMSAAIVSLVNPTMHGMHFFEANAMLITFILMGRWFESLAKHRTSQSLRQLTKLQPSTAILMDTTAGTECPIATQLVQVGDVLKVLPGSKVPTDGTVLDGATTVDESMVTGESAPVAKGPEDALIGGTINQGGLIVMRAAAVGNDTFLQQVIRLVEQAQSTKVPVQQFADRVAGIFVPVIVGLALLTFAVWLSLSLSGVLPAWYYHDIHPLPALFALYFATAVVVIACPCALGLATPTAVMVGSGVGARLGLLVRSGAALEDAFRLKAIAFDKTGTLTYGKPTVMHILATDPARVTDRDLAVVLAAAESGLYCLPRTTHPLATAIVGDVTQRYPDLGAVATPTDLQNTPGEGLQCTVQGRSVLVGNLRMMERHGVALSPSDSETVRQWQDRAWTVVFCAVDGALAGVCALSDHLRPEAVRTIQALRHMGLEVRGRATSQTQHQYSHPTGGHAHGDTRTTALSIARQAGIVERNVFAQASVLKEIQRNYGGKVAMCGDGVNDADIVTAVDLSRTTFRRIRWNFVWALGYNVLAVPFATGVFYPLLRVAVPPWLAGLAMSLSSVSVVLSSLLLNLYKKPKLPTGPQPTAAPAPGSAFSINEPASERAPLLGSTV
ncbi:ion-transporting P-type ATPase [Paratrimastix pyriformis]|uniref:Ion-transporting P-type ATPase n=1 Tax=Paratrimastix pyriformis TaxID=342808 RepID=A0ABQ8UP26_9EUKA|nr:ion-transporting P-type ATPase [Paratrimastix pyriformis]